MGNGVAILPCNPMEVESGSSKTTEGFEYPTRLVADAKLEGVPWFPKSEPDMDLDVGA